MLTVNETPSPGPILEDCSITVGLAGLQSSIPAGFAGTVVARMVPIIKPQTQALYWKTGLFNYFTPCRLAILDSCKLNDEFLTEG